MEKCDATYAALVDRRSYTLHTIHVCYGWMIRYESIMPIFALLFLFSGARAAMFLWSVDGNIGYVISMGVHHFYLGRRLLWPRLRQMIIDLSAVPATCHVFVALRVF